MLDRGIEDKIVISLAVEEARQRITYKKWDEGGPSERIPREGVSLRRRAGAKVRGTARRLTTPS